MSLSYLPLTEADLPLLFRQADALAIRMQQRFFRLLAAELIFLSLGAFVGIFDFLAYPIGAVGIGGLQMPLSVSIFLAAALILAALVFRLFRSVSHADTRWYEARAVAESAKSLAWRYAVGGRPFEISKGMTVADTLLFHRLTETLTDVPGMKHRFALIGEESHSQITDAMRRLRQGDRAIRIEAYRVGRIVDQRNWYDRKQEANHNLAHRTHWALSIFEALGVIVVMAQIFLSPDIREKSINVQAFVAALATAGIAWAQTKRYQDLSISYHVAAKEALALEVSTPEEVGEDAWAAFVDDAESAFSREHRLWRATRSA